MAEGEVGSKVVVVEHDPGVADVLQYMLEDAGYVVETLIAPVRVVREVTRLQPALLVVDVRPGPDQYNALDSLRADPATRGIPVVVTTVSEAAAEASVASYNVRAVLTKPFDLEEFLAHVGHALGQPPLHATIPPGVEGEGLLAQAEAILAAHSRTALFAWANGLRQQSPWRERRDLPLSELFDSVPILVEALGASLRYGSATEYFKRHPEGRDRVCSHAQHRRQHGLELVDLVREYRLLRDELLGVVWRYLPEQMHRNDVAAVSRVFNGALDEIIETTVPAYLQPCEETVS